MSDTEMMAWIIGSGATLVAANWTRLKVAAYVVEQAIKDYEPQLQAFKEFKPIKWKTQTPEQKEAFVNFQSKLKDNDILVGNAYELRIPLPEAKPEVLSTVESFQNYVKTLIGSIHKGLSGDLALPLVGDVLGDAILNEALLRAFPQTAAIAGAGEASDFVLGENLKELLDRTGIIDQTAALLTDMAQIISEEKIVSLLETTADPGMAVFSLGFIANRERKLIKAGYSKPGESATYGLLDYGSRLTGGMIAMEAADFITDYIPIEEVKVPITMGAWIVGVMGGKSFWKWLMKREMRNLTEEYSSVAYKVSSDLESKKKDILNKTDVVAKKTFGEYETVVHACPDLAKRADLAACAQNLVDAFNKDMALADTAVKSRREAIISSVSEPGFLSRALGANWKKAMEQRLNQIVKIHEKDIGILRHAFPSASDPSPIIILASRIPSVEGGWSEKAYDTLPGEIDGILRKYKDEASAWSSLCDRSWKKAANETIGTLNKQQNIFSETYASAKGNLEYLQRKIFSKGMRLHPDYN
ncbi:MAG: hypothetical protein WBK55_06465 [Alphaproteobacteria bacterium]